MTVECPPPAYLAGYFDGEGCVFIQKPRKRADRWGGETQPRVVVVIGNTFEPIIRAMQQEYGGCVIDSRSKAVWNTCRPFYQLRLQGPHAARFLTVVLPYLVEKQGRANAALFILDTQRWPRNRARLSDETLCLRAIAMRYFRQNPNGHANKNGGAPKGAGRPRGAVAA
jgi:hypothetical protein